MGAPATKVLDTEQERLQRVNDLIADYGADWAEQYKPGSFGCHELLDRIAMTADLVEQYVQSHPACIQKPEWFALAEQAVIALRELYQRVGAEHLDDSSQAAGNP